MKNAREFACNLQFHYNRLFTRYFFNNLCQAIKVILKTLFQGEIMIAIITKLTKELYLRDCRK